jgi:hypothetical protein
MVMRHYTFSMLVTAVVLLAAIKTADASPLLDAAWEPVGPLAGAGESFVSADQTLGQTFTVGITGVLTQVEVLFDRFAIEEFGFGSATDDLLISIWSTADGLPVTSLTSPVAFLASSAPTRTSAGSSDDPSTYAWLSAAVSLPVKTGQVLAIVASSATPGTSPFGWFSYSHDPSAYASGNGVLVLDGAWGDAPSDDFAFRTFVEPQTSSLPVPEPGSILLLALGIGSVFSRRKSLN